jgi:hypothetical protein
VPLGLRDLAIEAFRKFFRRHIIRVGMVPVRPLEQALAIAE